MGARGASPSDHGAPAVKRRRSPSPKRRGRSPSPAEGRRPGPAGSPQRRRRSRSPAAGHPARNGDAHQPSRRRHHSHSGSASRSPVREERKRRRTPPEAADGRVKGEHSHGQHHGRHDREDAYREERGHEGSRQRPAEGSGRDRDRELGRGEHRERKEHGRNHDRPRNHSQRDEQQQQQHHRSSKRSPSPPRPARNGPQRAFPPPPPIDSMPPPPQRQQQRQPEQPEQQPDWGKPPPNGSPNANPGAAPAAVNKAAPSMELSGKLAAETNKINGVVMKFTPPQEARRCTNPRWRLYVFKGEETVGQPLPLDKFPFFLFGKERKLADVPTDHPSCSRQHAVICFREVTREDRSGLLQRVVAPYLMDLETVNGTYINGERIEASRFYELMEKDVIKFGLSSREYVLLHDRLVT